MLCNGWLVKRHVRHAVVTLRGLIGRERLNGTHAVPTDGLEQLKHIRGAQPKPTAHPPPEAFIVWPWARRG
jgi:hypothetical protein